MRMAQVYLRYYPDAGGAETPVKEVSERLAKKGREVEVLTTDPPRKLPKENVINGVKVRRFRSFAPNDIYHFCACDAETMRTSIRVAETIKYARNAYLAKDISFANEVGNLCQMCEVDSVRVLLELSTRKVFKDLMLTNIEVSNA